MSFKRRPSVKMTPGLIMTRACMGVANAIRIIKALLLISPER